MAEEKNKDLTTEELLKKLMENFGEEAPKSGGEQLTIDDVTEKSTHKVYRCRNGKKEEAPGEAPEGMPDDEVSEMLLKSIRDAERFASGMKETEEEPEKPEEPEGRAKDTAETEDEEPAEELPAVAFEPSDIPNPEKDRMAAEKVLVQTEKAEEPEKRFEEEPEEPFAGVQEKPAEPETEKDGREESEPEEVLFRSGAESPDLQKEEAGVTAEEESEELQELQEPQEPEEPEEPEKSEESQEPQETEEPELIFPRRAEQPVFREPEQTALQEPEEKAGERGSEIPEEEAPEEPAGKEEKLDENEVNLMMIFEMENDLEKKLGKEEVRKLRSRIEGDAKAESVEEEYESPAQNERFFAKYRKAYRLLGMRSVFCWILFLLAAVFEVGVTFFKGNIEGLLSPAFRSFVFNPVNLALLGMQVTLLIGAASYKEVLNGFRAIGSGRAVPEVFLSLQAVFTLLYEIGLLICHNVNGRLFNMPLALMALVAVSFTRTNLKRNLFSFKIVSSRKPKYVITGRKGKETTLEKEAFGEYVSDGAGIYGVGKTEFVSGFAKRSAKEPKYKGMTGILAAIVVVVGLVFFVLGYYFSPSESFRLKLLSALGMCILSVSFCMPVSAFITYSLPFYKASKRAFADESAVVGEFSLEEYSDATVISFDDKEVFPAKNVKVRSLKLFGDSRIDHVLFGAASVFRKLGGPLDEVFAAATGETGYTDDVDILEVEKNGVEAAVKGTRVYVGSAEFMRSRSLLSGVEPEDEAMEMEGKIKIMYLAIGGELASKMYVEYKADAEIRGIMESLYKSGMCIGIRTLDPNIDDRMLRRHVELNKYPVKVLRMSGAEEKKTEKSMDSGVVSRKGVKELLKALASCRRVLQVIRTNSMIKALGLAAGIGVSILILVLVHAGKVGGIYEVGSVWAVLYQIIWMLPTALVALLFA